MGDAEREIVVATDRQIVGPAIQVTGTPPPASKWGWWPWAVGALVLGGLWYLTREQGRRPLGDAG